VGPHYLLFVYRFFLILCCNSMIYAVVKKIKHDIVYQSNKKNWLRIGYKLVTKKRNPIFAKR
jgi:uncharacterized membrane protein YcgQ (UPF0703/DUF1980 family)